MNEQEHENGHNGHATFLSGIVVGILIALLFTTKRGRQLLKVISDEGIGKFHKWEDLLELIEQQLEGAAALEEEPVLGEDLKEEVKEIEAPQKIEVKEEKKEEKVKEPERQKAEKVLEEVKEEVKAAEESIVEKIEEKVKEVEAIADELREVKEAIEEKRLESESVMDVVNEVTEEPKVEEDLPLHKAVEEAPATEEKKDEEPKKKSRRLFKGIRRK